MTWSKRLQPLVQQLHRLRKGGGGLFLWVGPFIFLGLFFLLPLSAVFRTMLQTQADPTALQGAGPLLWNTFSFTVGQAALSTLLTLLVGLPAAYVLARFRFPGQSLLRVLSTLPFILPTVVAAAGFHALLGPRGWVNNLLMAWFQLDQSPLQIINTLGAILLAHVFYNTSVVLRVVGSAWSQLDRRQEHAARVLGASAWQTFWQVTLPLLRPAVFSASLLVFLFDFTSFGVILVLGGPGFSTLETEIYLQALSYLNLPLAGVLSAMQLGFTLIITLLYNRVSAGQKVPLAPRLRGEGQRKPRTWRERLMVVFTILVLLVLLTSPLIALAARSVTRIEAERGERSEVKTGFTLDYYRELFINRRQSLFYVPPIAAVQNSLTYAAVTVVLSVSLGLLASIALTRPLAVNRPMEALLMLPLGTSAVTLGLGFLLVFNRPPLDVRSFPLLVPFAHSLAALPFVVRSVQPVLASIPKSLRQAAGVLGANPWRVWMEVDLPIISRALTASAVFAFTVSLGEFGATSFLARPETPTMPIAIYRFFSQPGALNYGQAMAMSTLLLLVCLFSLLVIERLQTGLDRFI